jgi:hypothetical protein
MKKRARAPAPVTDLSENEADGNTRGILLVGSRKTKRDWKSYAMHKSQQTPCLVRCGASDKAAACRKTISSKGSFQAAVAQLAARVRLLDARPGPGPAGPGEHCHEACQLRGFIECFSGSDNLTQVWLEAGHQVFPMDINKSAEHDMSELNAGGALLLRQCATMIRVTRNKPVVHFAPPCCTYSVARFPKIRAKEYPHGLPANVLNPLEKRTLMYANRVTANTTKIMKVLSGFGIPVHFEQPLGSLMQRERCFRSWAASSGAAKCVVDYCCFGAPFRKSTALWSSPPWLLAGLEQRCPGDHEHEVTLSRWGAKDRNLATGNGSSAYPVQLCRAWHGAVLKQILEHE